MADETSVVDKYQYTFVAKLLKVKIPLMWFRELYLSASHSHASLKYDVGM